jgi:hypothetical protein
MSSVARKETKPTPSAAPTIKRSEVGSFHRRFGAKGGTFGRSISGIGNSFATEKAFNIAFLLRTYLDELPSGSPAGLAPRVLGPCLTPGEFP